MKGMERWCSILAYAVSGCCIAAENHGLFEATDLQSPPVLDGSCSEWPAASMRTISLHPSYPGIKTSVPAVDLYLGMDDAHVYLCASWQDTTGDSEHKPYVWDEKKERYVKGAAREDRFAVQFEMSGDYTTDWISGNSFTADIWHWKSVRSNPLNLAHDKMTQVSTTPLLRAWEGKARNGEKLYILRPTDSGTALYRTKRYGGKQQAVMPKYLLTPREEISGSIADVSARGVWREGRWTLELSRKRDTGHDDDVVLGKGTRLRGGIAVFDASDDHDHMVSDTLTFQF